MQRDFAATAAPTDLDHIGAARRYAPKNWNELKTKEQPRKKSRLLKITMKNEDHTMDQNNGLEGKISKGDTRTILTMDSGKIPLLLIIISLEDQTSPMGTTTRTIEDHMINTQISHSIETMEIDFEMVLSTIGTGIGKTMEIFPVLHRFKGGTSHKIFHNANQEVINLTVLPSADLTINLRLLLRPTNKNFHKTITRRHLI